jgi:hypothetical protein
VLRDVSDRPARLETMLREHRQRLSLCGRHALMPAVTVLIAAN